MKEVASRRSHMLQRILAAAVAAALLSTLVPSLAAPDTQERMAKDIAIMENVINTSMVESEFVYIYNTQNNVRGLHIPEFGALFTVQVQLISDLAVPYFITWNRFGGQKGAANPFWTMYQMDRRKLEKLVDKLDITVNGKKVSLDEYFEQMEKTEGDDQEYKVRIEKSKELIERNLEEFKEELAGLVADYGGTIRQLDDDQWVMIVAYLDPTRGLHTEEQPNKVLVKAKKSDIDLYDSGKIDQEELRSRMTVEVE